MPKDSPPITPALHSSGVVSRSPYPGAYSTPSNPLSREFIHKWVIPFYMVINAEETEKLAPKVRQVLPELTPAALASFETPEAADYLKRYLDFYLRRPECWYDQGAAMAALCWLDDRHGSNRSSAFHELWNDFIVNKQNWDLESSKSLFSGWMQHLAQMRLAIEA